MIDLVKKKMDIAYDMFGAISAISILQLHKDDRAYLIQQLTTHFVGNYTYYEHLGKLDGVTTKNLVVKIDTAKKNVIAFIEKKYGHICSRTLNDIFGQGNWQHVIVDGSINYET